jgi:hypothetical protein
MTDKEEATTKPPSQSEDGGPVDPKLMKLLAEYLSSERAENGWRQHFKDSLKSIHDKIEVGHVATRDVADKVLELSTELDTHIVEEEKSIESIRGYLATHKAWQDAVDKKLRERDDWDEITGQHVVEELRQKRESDRARGTNRRKVLWWALGIVGVFATNAGTAFLSQCESTPGHGVQSK